MHERNVAHRYESPTTTCDDLSRLISLEAIARLTMSCSIRLKCI
jgi:hypothetical protein